MIKYKLRTLNDADQLANASITYAQAFSSAPRILIGGYREEANLDTSERRRMTAARYVSVSTTVAHIQFFNDNNDFDGDESVRLDYEAIGEWS
jgi:hypothetical protein